MARPGRRRRQRIDREIHEPERSGGGAFVAVVDHRVVGFVSLSSTDHFAGERDAYIGELIVEEAFEGGGVGRRLIDAAEQ